MVRTAVFDPTDKDGFIEQRQRFDWTLLQNGTVFRYEAAFHLDSACDRLAALGYLVHRIDGDDWTSTGDMYDAFARAMSYDPDYGRGRMPSSTPSAMSRPSPSAVTRRRPAPSWGGSVHNIRLCTGGLWCHSTEN